MGTKWRKMMSEQVCIPEGTLVSFIDPVTQKPVRGVVKLELKKFIGVEYTGKNEAPKPGAPPHTLVDKEGKYFAFTNISKEKVFVVR
jgi:hypothetical protein